MPAAPGFYWNDTWFQFCSPLIMCWLLLNKDICKACLSERPLSYALVNIQYKSSYIPVRLLTLLVREVTLHQSNTKLCCPLMAVSVVCLMMTLTGCQAGQVSGMKRIWSCLDVAGMGDRQAAQPTLQHRLPERAVLEARKPYVGRQR